MLILTRRPDESIVLTTPEGQEIQFFVLGVKGNQVRIGIEADESIKILRSELTQESVD
jgi:carbon storage regulator